MNKSLKYLLISLLALCVNGTVCACYTEPFLPGDSHMYRVVSATSYPKHIDVEYSGYNRCATENCLGWQRLSSKNISLSDIYKVVYKMPLEDFQVVYDNRKSSYINRFLEWITKRDTDLLELLYVAKCNEYVRNKYNSRWYYPTMNIDAPMTLDQIIEKSLKVKESRLRDRYLLQAVRALFSLGRFEQCVELWDSEISHLPEDNLMLKLIKPYIAGAEYRTNNSEKALQYLAELGDVQSILYCKGLSGVSISAVEGLEIVCQYAPNSSYIARTLQSIVRELEDSKTWCSETNYMMNLSEVQIAEIAKLKTLSIKMAKDSRTTYPAMWYYTAAFLSDLTDQPSEALRLLSLAEQAKSTTVVSQSIRVMRIYLDAKHSIYNNAYEKKLFGQLKWLDSQIVNNIDDRVRDITAECRSLYSNKSYYYWNDMLRKIVLCEVCPRMLEAGKSVRALQLANMADNRLLNLVNNRREIKYVRIDEDEYEEVAVNYTMAQYRYLEGRDYGDGFNEFDYCNNFFNMIDTLGVSTAAKYLRSVENNQTEFDRYLNARGYTGVDYLNDIVGTQYIRSMRYADAVKHLKKVSYAYNMGHLNVELRYDPFQVLRRKMPEQHNTKYRFACEMLRLENSINSTTDANVKAKDMVKFAIGLRNSFTFCWPLTDYGWNYDNLDHTKLAKEAFTRVEYLMDSAPGVATDEKVASEILYTLARYKTLVEKYPESEKGELVRGSCDKLIDYKVQHDK